MLLPLRKLEEENIPIIEKRIISQIFSNFETLAAVNRELLKRLEERMQNWADTNRLADIFITMVRLIIVFHYYLSSVNLYANFCNKFFF